MVLAARAPDTGGACAPGRELASVPSPGRLEPALARSLGDPGLRLAYPLADGRYVDADGRQLDPGHASTPLVRHGVEVAMLDPQAWPAR